MVAFLGPLLLLELLFATAFSTAHTQMEEKKINQTNCSTNQSIRGILLMYLCYIEVDTVTVGIVTEINSTSKVKSWHYMVSWK